MRILCLIFVLLLAASCSLTAPPSTTPSAKRVPAPSPRNKTETPEARRPPPPVTEPPPPPVPPPPVPSSPAVKEYQLSPASKALVAQAKTLAASGDFPVAVSTIERALRIEPTNPLLWIELGNVHQASANYAQAESTARKALSLASSDLRAQATAWQLIAQSLRARGKVQEAQIAQARADALMPD